jgi:aldose 1-epimerase
LDTLKDIPTSTAGVTLTDVSGMRVALTSHGAAIAGIYVPDANQGLADVTVSAADSSGKTIGRYANRIAGARFTLDGGTYTLPANEGPNTLHGGPDGFSKRDRFSRSTRLLHNVHGFG